MRAPDFWQIGGPLAVLLRPLGAAYALGGAVRRSLVTPWQASVPVVCVGNLTVGGTGKTPVVLDLARRLAQRQPHIVTRGYGGRLAGPVRVDPKLHSAEDVGDEPLLLARRTPVWVARDRVAGARAAIAARARLLLLDDGFQNPTLAKDLSLIVVDGEAGFGNGLVFPAGPLREPVRVGLTRADAVVVIGQDRHGIAASSPLPVLQARLVPKMPLSFAPGAPIVAFAGIGRPEKFFATLRGLGADPVAARAFPDHHRFRGDELLRLEGLAAGLGARLVTTAKDAVRLPPSWRARVAVLRVAIEWDDTGALDRVLARIG
ncbi:lipid-A-disaccharide kinase [Stella humosa]|uniref:Tetraacyldisaccharide 4'-kinase n=1 Tax=Stella humosa TaxID=94 RepID=A0A3N1LL33_9PROT|nr:tetraacyldisaccharide 4'-kinase [Stella humosa]ROP91136.1 lipid-A-disaccharide kinase [Stella humosa]BBK34512.1 tetraacyldisaccharide 4'-kinase [Stella humosa]